MRDWLGKHRVLKRITKEQIEVMQQMLDRGDTDWAAAHAADVAILLELLDDLENMQEAE